MPRTPLSEKPTLAEFQSFVAALVEEKGWTKDPKELFVLLTEEVGELAHDLRLTWTKGTDDIRPKLESEMADVFLYLIDLANVHGVDLETAIRNKVAFNDTRTDFGH